jgi:hypothetical protein
MRVRAIEMACVESGCTFVAHARTDEAVTASLEVHVIAMHPSWPHVPLGHDLTETGE